MAFIIAEYCSANFYMGWWLYERDTNDGNRNSDGEWGWLRESYSFSQQAKVRKLCVSMGNSPPELKEHSQALAEWFAKQFPNGLEVERLEYGEYRLLSIPKSRPKQHRHSIRTIRGAEQADRMRRKKRLASTKSR